MLLPLLASTVEVDLSLEVAAQVHSNWNKKRDVLSKPRTVDNETEDVSVASPEKVVSWREILKLFLPLTMASFTNTLVPPLINAGIVRVADVAESSLAAYSVASNLIWLLSPFVVMVPHAYLVLVKNQESFSKLRGFMLFLGGGVMVVGVLLAFTPLANLVLGGFIGLTSVLAWRTTKILRILLLLPIISICRSFFHGMLISRHRGDLVWWGGLGGLLALLAGIGMSRYFRFLPGDIYGTLMALTAAGVETGILGWGISRLYKRGYSNPDNESKNYSLTYPEIFRFFLPLVLTTWIMGFSPTVINSGLARSANPVISIAAFSVASSIIFALESPVIVIRSIVLAFVGKPHTIRRLRSFSFFLGAIMTSLLALIGFTKLAEIVLMGLIGVSQDVYILALPMVRILSVVLVILAWRQFNYALLMHNHKTRHIGYSALARLAFLTIFLFAGIRLLPNFPTYYLATIAYIGGFIVETSIVHARGSGLVPKKVSPLA